MWIPQGGEKSWVRAVAVPRSDGTENDQTIIAVEIPLVVLAFGTVVLRVYSRLGIKRKLALDDVLIICAMICALVRTIISCMSAGEPFSFDRQGYVHSSHSPPIPTPSQPHPPFKSTSQIRTTHLTQPLSSPETQSRLPYYRHIFLRRLAYLLSILLTRLSILTYYLRIFPPQLPTLRLLSLSLLLLATAHFLTVLTILSTLCSKIHLLWTPSWRTFHAPQCFSSPLYSYAAAIGDTLVDALIFALPLPYVWRLSKLQARQRAGLVVVFGLGFLVCAVAMAQNPFIRRRLDDGMYFGGAINLLVAVQVSVGIVAASLPDLRALGARVGAGLAPLHHRSWNTRVGLGGRCDGEGGGSRGDVEVLGREGRSGEEGSSTRDKRGKTGLRRPDWLRDSLPGSLMGTQIEEVGETRTVLTRVLSVERPVERPAMVRRPSLAIVDAVSKVLTKDVVELPRKAAR